jgi:hypothetical protein
MPEKAVTLKKVSIRHEKYGCDCGCCGHAVYLDGVRKAFAMRDWPELNDKPGRIAAWARDLAEYELTDDELEDADLDHIDVTGVVPHDGASC